MATGGDPAGPAMSAKGWYAHDDDPFGVGTLWYERRKRAVVAACLQQERYARAWDVASGTGHLAQDLLGRCAELVGSDADPRAVELTRDRLTSGGSGEPQTARVLQNRLPSRPPGLAACDLVLLSEVLYYLDDGARAMVPDLLEAVTAGSPGAEVVAVTWRHHPHDGHLSGAAAHAELHTALTDRGWSRLVDHQDEDFVLHSWTAPSTGGQP
ncbi:methyltransferase [Kytococcus sedentarius]|uniref:methyltransferase n=1 Tax=Kytococcus sedentarius TaxID=1276 RepID=UPI0035BC3621